MASIRTTRLIVWGLTTAIIAASTLPAQHRKVILDDLRARVSLVTLMPGQSYLAQGASPYGSVWVSLDDGVVAEAPGLPASGELFVQAGDKPVETIAPGSTVKFSVSDKASARIVIVDVKSEVQALTLDPVSLSAFLEMQDASAQNDALLIAESVLQLQDVLDVGEEGNPRRGKPHLIRMKPGDVIWVKHGIHYIKNLLATPAGFTVIEW